MFTLVRALLVVSSLLASRVAHAAPLGLPRDSSDTQTVTLASVQPLLTPARFARAAYCSSASVQNLTCGQPCKDIGDVDVLLTGGDNKETPNFYVAYDKVNDQVVVAHQGTNTNNLASILNDLKLTRSGLNETLFKDVPDGVEVHDGFQGAHGRSADAVLSTVQSALADSGAKKLLVVGHSLGAAIATLDAMMLRSRLPAGVTMDTVVFGLPRMGNQEWADFVDAQLGSQFTHVSNDQDPIPQVPSFLLGFQHPSGEVHIKTGNVTLVCDGQENENCSRGNDFSNEIFQNHKGPYFEAAIRMGGGSCPGFQDEDEIGFFDF
ncbi:alpha/beta-hydrolase [Punctularia strigosozonata HHB-11173 SS5]|uniref:alpha/beta-hydrolase n=1 Tax=Punctularia strigosozonata (strain HHB-11173) TaxID=741275 RepID=UPI0004416908|nr:alpha/beta-hydrolase [Punctularia strigosozonata HHB-11173 SS5]EIN05744.1 alpha/beta-hydrolase [Punctularia strigosozonata HHB-11173 SS5]